MIYCRKKSQKVTVYNMEHAYCMWANYCSKHALKIRNTFLFSFHERRSALHHMNIASLVMFASIMNEISEQHLHASSFYTFSKVHICTWLYSSFGLVNSTEVEI